MAAKNMRNQNSRVIPALELAFRELAMRSKMYVKAMHIIEDARRMLPQNAESSESKKQEEKGK